MFYVVWKTFCWGTSLRNASSCKASFINAWSDLGWQGALQISVQHPAPGRAGFKVSQIVQGTCPVQLWKSPGAGTWPLLCPFLHGEFPAASMRMTHVEHPSWAAERWSPSSHRNYFFLLWSKEKNTSPGGVPFIQRWEAETTLGLNHFWQGLSLSTEPGKNSDVPLRFNTQVLSSSGYLERASAKIQSHPRWRE